LVAPDTLEGTKELLGEWLHLTSAQRENMGHCARGLFRAQFTVSAMADSLLAVIRQNGVRQPIAE
jgi:hypothetical protein